MKTHIIHISYADVDRIRTADGRYYYLQTHPYLGAPDVYRDRDCTREVVDWYNDEGIGDAVNWWMDKYWRPRQ